MLSANSQSHRRRGPDRPHKKFHNDICQPLHCVHRNELLHCFPVKSEQLRLGTAGSLEAPNSIQETQSVYSYALSPSSTVDRDEVRDAGLTNVGMARSGWE